MDEQKVSFNHTPDVLAKMHLATVQNDLRSHADSMGNIPTLDDEDLRIVANQTVQAMETLLARAKHALTITGQMA